MKSGLLKRIKWKNLLFAILGIVLLVFAVYKIIDSCWTNAEEKFKLMPSNAPLYIASNSNSLLSNQEVLSDLSTKFIEQSFLNNFMSQIKSVRAQLKDSSHSEMLSGMYQVNNHEYNFLHVLYVGFHWNTEPAIFFNANFLANQHFEKRTFKSYAIYENAIENSDFSYTYKNGFLVISQSSDLIDNFIRKYENGEVLSKNGLFADANRAFDKKNKQASKKSFKIILNYEQSASFSELIAEIRGEKLLNELATIKGFSVLELAFNKNVFTLKGVSAFDNLLLTESISSASNLMDYLPENVAILSSFNIASIKKKNNRLEPIFTNDDIDKIAFFEIENRDVQDDKFAGCIWHSKNLKSTLSQLTKVNNNERSTILYGTQQIPLQGTNIKNEIHELFGHAFYQITAPSYFYINDYIIFVNKMETAQYIADHYFSKNTLKIQQSNAYQFEFRQDLIPQLTEQLFRLNDTSNTLSCIKSINKLSLSLNHSDGLLETEIIFTLDKNSKTEATNIVWQNQLQNKWITAPQIIEIPGAEHFYVVAQDEKKQVYLYNDAGELQWKKEIDSKLISNFYPIDYYNNATIQFVFHSENYLYIIDKYGNNIEDFPIRLGASTNLSMTVYHQNNSLYQSAYFIPCSNGNIYGFDVKGAPITGWNPKKVGLLKHSLQLSQQNKTSYLFGTTDNGNFYAWDIKGTEQLNLPAQLYIIPSFSSITVDTSTFLFNANHAHILKYSMDGKMEEKPFGPASDTFDYVAFLPKDSKVPNHAFMDGNSILILDQAGKKLMNYAFTEKMNLQLDHINIRNEDLFICTNISKTKTYMVTSKGTLYDGFPANLKTGLSFISISTNAYAVGMSDDFKVVCYRL